jgi:hypothetical protein
VNEEEGAMKLVVRRHRSAAKKLRTLTGVLAAVATYLLVRAYPDFRRYVRMRNM